MSAHLYILAIILAFLGGMFLGDTSHAPKPVQAQGVQRCHVVTDGMNLDHAAIVQGMIAHGYSPEESLKRADGIIGCRP